MSELFNLTAHILDGNLAAGRGHRPAIITDQRVYTYQDIAELTNRIGHVLLDLGVRRGERVILALSDSAEFVAAWYAVIKIGAVVGEVYTFLQTRDYAYYLNYSEARVVLADAITLPKIRLAAAQCPALRQILVVNSGAAAGDAPTAPDAAAQLAAEEVDFAALVAAAPAELDPADTTADDIALWKFTTGSTGAPKAAVHRQYTPWASYQNYARPVLGLTPDDRVLAVPKLFFGYARDLTALFTFGAGAAGIVFPERSTPERLFELIARHRPTVMVQVPTMVNMMVSHPAAATADLSSLRLCTSSGEALPAEVYQRWLDRFGVEIIEGFGSSEAYHIYMSSRPGASRPGSTGQLLPGYEGRLIDGDGQDVPAGEAGELIVSGATTALEYWHDPKKTAATFRGPWLHTGDLFHRDAEGFYWYQGRADDLLKVGGIWVAPLEIEGCLLEHPAVAECAVVGYEADGLTLPGAFVVPEAGPVTDPATDRAAAAELQAYVRIHLSPHKYPRQVWFVTELPKTASGKIDRKALRQRIQHDVAG